MRVQLSTGRPERKSPWPHRDRPAPSKSNNGMSKIKNLQIFRRHLVRRNTFSQEIKVTNWYHPIPSHQNIPEAAFPERENTKHSKEMFFGKSNS